ncbi:lantibiotic dehydratase family protein [Chryseobacterium jejuense]|uniref:Lantibiotic dehydratase, C terminus n=1 Tax=Chryseobacterium jejuense TaxID=445960 RepID=A0A2X2WY36_CHRJE|nr:lantibiotic dehydratase family protein [Chryseobacterium jejuense]SDJ89981.1 Lantibiotic dehydratase, C terminus [Chryseobacterium jejuense]SQB45588.1 Lantibiotic dehydratase, C terminus [Chryseobacterium jejuense]
MSRFPYQFFDEYIVRTPLFSSRKFLEVINKDEISDEELKIKFADHSEFLEAIYLASPDLHEEITRWLHAEKSLSQKEHQKLKHTLLKYYSRMSTRCTPFGLFSGVGLGKFNEDYKNRVSREDNLYADYLVRDTKLDMYFLVSLAQYFVKTLEIRNKLLFYPNNTIYRVGTKIRYIEYQYLGGKRDYIISSAPLSDELKDVLQFSKQGKTIQELTDILISEEITREDASEFIDELIDNQVLTSEIEPNVSGRDFLDTIISVLQRLKANEADILISIKSKLDALDQNIGNPTSNYAEIEKLIASFEIEYEQKYLFQTDLYHKDKATLSPSWKKEIKIAFSFLNKIILPSKDIRLEKFKRAFNERFEGQELPLQYVLDSEIGLGYKQSASLKGIHSYLDDLILPGSEINNNLSIELNPVQKVLNEKLQDALLESQYKIELSDDDFKELDEKWDDLPDTISFMTEIISDDDQEKLFLNGSTGSSAANLLGRFCSEKSEIHKLTRTIADKEESLNPEYILAEVIHLPEARIGNVVRRPTIRPYEIPYMAQSVVPEENQIAVDDLYISLQNNRIVLRSKRLNKEIRPYLTNAHNYFHNTLPVYHFLSDLYSQEIRNGLHFNWGGLKDIYKFFPRVEYKNIILSKASWKIFDKDISFSEQLILDKECFLSELKNWRIKRKIPARIQWVESDNTLMLNLENYDMATLFIHTIKKKKIIMIEEFLFNENERFKYEFVFPMYKINTDE